jgi:hypothetical protein
MKFRAIPQIPPGVDPKTRAVLAALKENFEILAGMRGDSNIVAELLGFTPARAEEEPWPAFHVTASPYPGIDQACTVDRIIGYTTGNNTVRLNSGDHFNPANGRFTAPEDGLYRFEATFSRSIGNAAVSLAKNGTAVAADSLSYGTDWQTSVTFAVLPLVKGDYVTATAGVRNATTVAHYSSSFSGHRIC